MHHGAAVRLSKSASVSESVNVIVSDKGQRVREPSNSPVRAKVNFKPPEARSQRHGTQHPVEPELRACQFNRPVKFILAGRHRIGLLCEADGRGWSRHHSVITR